MARNLKKERRHEATHVKTSIGNGYATPNFLLTGITTRTKTWFKTRLSLPMLTETDLLEELAKTDDDSVQKYIKQELVPKCNESKNMEEVYEDRNVAVLGFLRQLKTLKELSQAGSVTLDWDLQVGWRENSKTDEDWVAVCARLPEGQVSWTLKREDVPNWMTEVDMEYDSHSVEEKLDRVRNFCDL